LERNHSTALMKKLEFDGSLIVLANEISAGTSATSAAVRAMRRARRHRCAPEPGMKRSAR
jgi:hypothetical protein